MEKRTSPSQATHGGFDRARTINPPSRHEGIGNALRTAFDPSSYGLPDDLSNLLRQIDR